MLEVERTDLVMDDERAIFAKGFPCLTQARGAPNSGQKMGWKICPGCVHAQLRTVPTSEFSCQCAAEVFCTMRARVTLVGLQRDSLLVQRVQTECKTLADSGQR